MTFHYCNWFSRLTFHLCKKNYQSKMAGEMSFKLTHLPRLGKKWAIRKESYLWKLKLYLLNAFFTDFCTGIAFVCSMLHFLFHDTLTKMVCYNTSQGFPCKYKPTYCVMKIVLIQSNLVCFTSLCWYVDTSTWLVNSKWIQLVLPSKYTKVVWIL